MYTVDVITEGYLASPTREYDLRIGIVDGGTTYITQDSGNIYQISGDGNIQHSDYFTLGTFTARSLKFGLDSSISVPSNAEIVVEVRLNGASGYGDWIPMGTWYVDNRYESGSNVIVYKLYDGALYADFTYISSLTYPATIQAMWDEIAGLVGLSSDAVLDSVTIDEAPEGFHCRQVLGYLAAMSGGHFIINRSGNLDIVKPYANTSVDLTIDTSDYTDFKRIDDAVKTVTKVTCIYNTSDDRVSIGTDTGYELTFECPFITTTADLQDVFDYYDGFQFIPYSSLKWIGDPRIDLGDHISIVDHLDDLTTYDCYVMYNQWVYGGGLSMFTTGKVKSVTASEFPPALDIYRAIQDRSTFYDLYTEGRLQIHGGNIIAGTLAAESIASDKGYIAELTVDQLATEDKVQKYLDSDTSDVDYIKIYDQYLEFITATTDGSTFSQASDRNGNLLYWTDNTYTVSSTTPTIYPVYVYDYTETEKMEIAFENVNGVQTPVLTMGAGSGGPDDTNGKGFIFKGVDGAEFKYFDQLNNELREVFLSEDGIILTPTINPVSEDTNDTSFDITTTELTRTVNFDNIQNTYQSVIVELEVDALSDIKVDVEIDQDGVMQYSKKHHINSGIDSLSVNTLTEPVDKGSHIMEVKLTGSGTGTVNIYDYTCTVQQFPNLYQPPVTADDFMFTIETTTNGETYTHTGVPYAANPSSVAYIDWGDGSGLQTVTSGPSFINHTYAIAGQYQITVTTDSVDYHPNFYDDDNLVSIDTPFLPVVNTLDLSQGMFGCGKLVSVCGGLFKNCVANLDTSLYRLFFFSNLQSIPQNLFEADWASNIQLQAGAYYNFEEMFRGSKVSEVPSNLFDYLDADVVLGVSPALYAKGMFAFCQSLTTVGDTLLPQVGTGLSVHFEEMFYFDQSLTTVGANAFSSVGNVGFNTGNSFRNAFRNCTTLTSISSTLVSNFKSVTADVSGMFRDSGLTSYPTGMFDVFIGANTMNFADSFRGCDGMTNACDDLWNDFPTTNNNSDCFRDCTNLTNYASIPTAWK